MKQTIQRILPNNRYFSEWMRFLNRKEEPIIEQLYPLNIDGHEIAGGPHRLTRFDTSGNPNNVGLDDLWIATYTFEPV